MVDEGGAATEAAVAVAALDGAEGGAEAPDAEIEAAGGCCEIDRARAVPSSPSGGSGASMAASVPQAAAGGGQGAAGAPDDVRELVLQGRRASAGVCAPLRKVRQPISSPERRHLCSGSAVAPLPWLCTRRVGRAHALERVHAQRAHNCPACLRGRVLLQVLNPHQVEGARWLFRAIEDGGGVLADDPGLGKTIQVITVLEACIHSNLHQRILIVTPANVLANWDAVRA